MKFVVHERIFALNNSPKFAKVKRPPTRFLFTGFVVAAMCLTPIAAQADSTPTEEQPVIDVTGEEVEIEQASDGQEFWVDETREAAVLPAPTTQAVLWDDEDEKTPPIKPDPPKKEETKKTPETTVPPNSPEPKEPENPKNPEDNKDSEPPSVDGLCSVPLGENIDEGLAKCAEDVPDDEPAPNETAPVGGSASSAASISTAVAYSQPKIVKTAAVASQCTYATSKIHYFSRFNACYKTRQTFSLVNSRRAVVGSILFEAVTQTWANARSNKIANDTSVHILNQTGVARGRVFNVKGNYKCTSTGCTSAKGTFNKAVSSGWSTAQGTSTFGFSSGRNGLIREAWSFTITSPGVAFNAIHQAVALAPRCDTNGVAGMGSGCAYTAVTPVFSVASYGSAAQMGSHVRKAIASGLPSTLTRATVATKNANRSKACPSSLKRDPGYECDEYPFASSNQGAAKGGKARVPSGCRWKAVAGYGSVGWSRCMIKAGDNRVGGSMLTSFYLNNRVIVNDKFSVKVT